MELPPSALVVVRPGDTLVIGINVSLDMQQADECSAQLTRLLPDIHVVVIDKVSAFAVYRKDAD